MRVHNVVVHRGTHASQDLNLGLDLDHDRRGQIVPGIRRGAYGVERSPVPPEQVDDHGGVQPDRHPLTSARLP